MPLPPARLPTPRQAIERRNAEMRARMNALKQEYLEPILSRFPHMLPTKPDSAARYALYSAVAWFGIWMLMAATLAIKIVFPEFLSNYGFMSFGRLRQAETNVLQWGVLFMGTVGAAFAIVPRCCQVRLWSERIGAQLVVGLNQVVLAGTVLVMLGRTQGIDGGEWPWPVDLALVAIMFGALQVVMTTVMRRGERRLNHPLRYFIAAFLVLPITYAVANFISPYVFGVKQVFYTGFGSAGFMLAMTLAGIGATLFVLPRATGNGIWSGPLASATLLILLFTGPFMGLSQRVLGPAPDWTETLGITFALASIVPAVFVFALVVATARGGRRDDPSVTFMVGATVIWATATVLFMAGAFRQPAAILGTTPWNEGVRTAMFGAFGMWLVGLTYHLIPRIRGRALRSRGLVTAHFWLAAPGISIAAGSLAVAGLVQGYLLSAGAGAGAKFAVGEGWAQIVTAVKPMLVARMAAGALMFAGVILFLFNVQQTLAEGEDVEPELPAPEAAVVEAVR